MQLSNAAHYADNAPEALKWAQLGQQADLAQLPGWVARRYTLYWALAMNDVGQGALGQRSCTDMLTTAEAAGDLGDQAAFHETIVYLARHTGQLTGAGEHLRQAIALALRTSNPLRLVDCLDNCAHLCAATGRWAEAITLWAAFQAHNAAIGVPDLPQDERRRQEPLRKATQALGAGRARAAGQRGATMTLETAAEFAAILTQQETVPAARPPGTLAAHAPGARTGHPGSQRPHRRTNRHAALHQRPHRPLAPGPHPRQKRPTAARRTHPASPARRPGLTPAGGGTQAPSL